LSEKGNVLLRPLKKKGFKEEWVTTMRLDDLGKSTTLESNKSLGRIRPGPKPLIFMRFHVAFLGNQHEMWSKPHNGKVRKMH
jgi:hypothetical protein